MKTIISKHKGHLIKGKEKNPYIVCEDDKGKFVEMFTKKGSFLFDFDDIDLVSWITEDNKKRHLTWHFKRETNLKYRVGFYVRTQINKGKKVYLHQYILDHYGSKKNDLTVDHIDRNPLNNRRHNLRLATKSEQASNITKRHRSYRANNVPDKIKDITLPKYISYTRYNRNTKLGYYDMFIIQCHPIQNKKYGEKTKWATQMSMKLDLLEKLKQALDKLKEFDKKHEQAKHFINVLNELHKNKLSNTTKLRETPKVLTTTPSRK